MLVNEIRREKEESLRLAHIGVDCQLFTSSILVKCSLVEHVTDR